MDDVFAMVVVFTAIYMVIKSFTDFLLKRKIINSGHIDKAGILVQENEKGESNRYPTLKWGLVSFFAGIGLVLLGILSRYGWNFNNYEGSMLSFGIELVYIAAGFLIYFLIMSVREKNEK
ncbi:MAG TPA: hypothetical protein VE912_03895 [Bacteroidales bacterium]|nr:hypothetical protein [Bacteroidales bacterium]